MQISYIEKKGKSKVQITLQNSECFIMNEKEWKTFDLKPGDDIEEAFIIKLYEEYFLPKAKLKALNLLKSRDHSEKELYQKLRTAGFPDSVIKKTMEYIESYHYIDDHRLARNYVTYHGQMKSRKEILYNLSVKGIDIQTMNDEDNFMEEHDDRKTISKILFKRWGEEPAPDLKEKERMLRYLARRGFAAQDIFSVFQDLGI